MCLILFAYHQHPKFKLIVGANRDEFYDRPTTHAHFWEDHPQILAGRDLLKMGTWMGITKTGRFAALTNYRDPGELTAGKQSRGNLVADFLKGETVAENYLAEVAKKRDLFAGFNLLTGSKDELYFYSNIENKVKKLDPGIYGLSNNFLNTDWPKVNRGKAGLTRIINESDNKIGAELMQLLQNSERAPDKELPSTGVPLEWEQLLSPLFIESETYGTRSSAVMLLSDNEIIMTEQIYSQGKTKDQEFRIKLN
ncbi:NRDE family protein [Bacillaceae bacterium IKA-2]|nr:NRDE family protein [Bacillaceae bacterium IKA-2]